MTDLRTVTVATTPSYPVHIGDGAHAASTDILRQASALIADERVHELHGASLALGDLPLHTLPQGEAAKTLAHLEATLDFLCSERLDRDATIVVLGGGAATDLGGLAASMYLRGVAWIASPTTLLAMVDASVGGKTAVNLRSGKNLAGTFHQPIAVVADTRTIQTLPAEEYASGLGEVLKTALIEGEESLSLLESNTGGLLERDANLLTEVVHACVSTKARIVASDPNEAGDRKALNLGHTFGHAIEQVAGPGAIPHGICVAAGCGLAISAAAAAGILTDSTLAERYRALAAALGLPSDLASLRASTGLALSADALLSAMSHDKKARAGTPRFVLPCSAGVLELDIELDVAAILA